MKRTRTIIFASIIGLLMIAPAYATLSSNLVTNGGFSTAPTAAGSSGTTITAGTWYYSGDWGNQTSGGQSGAYEQLGNNKSGNIFELMSAPTGATSGQVAVAFYQKGSSVTTAEVALYGYSTAPTFGNITSGGSATGTPIDLTTGHDITSTLPVTGSFVQWSSSLGASASTGYAYYLIFIRGDTGTGGASYGIDTVSAEVTVAAPVPIPPTVWLLAAGLIGLVGIRRGRKSHLKG